MLGRQVHLRLHKLESDWLQLCRLLPGSSLSLPAAACTSSTRIAAAHGTPASAATGIPTARATRSATTFSASPAAVAADAATMCTPTC